MSTPRYIGRRQLGFAAAAAAPLIAGSGPAAPFVAVALLAAPVVAKLLQNVGKGCGQSCVLTSDAANQIEEKLKANVAAYMASGRTKAEQAAAIAVFQAYWNALVEYCGKPEFQSTKAGRNCIDDRKDGACTWKQGGQCWNWWTGYYWPIANDAAKPDSASGVTPGGTTQTAAGTPDDPTRYLIPAALIGLALAVSL